MALAARLEAEAAEAEEHYALHEETESESDEDSSDEEWEPTPERKKRLKREAAERRKKKAQEAKAAKAAKKAAAKKKNEEKKKEEKRRPSAEHFVDTSLIRSEANDSQISIESAKDSNLCNGAKTFSPGHIILDQAVPGNSVPKAPSVPRRDPPSAPSELSELSELHRKIEAQMIGGKNSLKGETKSMARDAYSRQGHVVRNHPGRQKEQRSRQALGSVSANTSETMSRKQQLIAYQEKKKLQNSRRTKVSAQSKVHAHMKSKKTLVVAGGITRKDRYSDIYGHRQRLAAKQMR